MQKDLLIRKEYDMSYMSLKKFLKEFEDNHKRPFIVAVDFDGTLCEEKYPAIGKEKPMMVMIVYTLQKLGVYTILWTCRSGEHLEQAKDWCKEKGLVFDKYNEHADCFLELFDCKSPKIAADMYLDDRAHNAVFGITDLKHIEECYRTSRY